MNRGPSGNPRCMGPHGAAWGRMGLHGAAWGRMVPHRATWCLAWGLVWGPSKT
jgi:hypothetical protein